MLSELAIKNFAIIEDLRICFQPGLSVLTGETGAGKSIIIQAVSLLLGTRASGDLVRTGQETAELEACFDIATDSVPAKLL
ncbi:MAG: AAA family ATPase, partial [Desulfotignum sp.]